MDKKIIYIGIGLLILAIIMIFVAPSVAFQFNTSTFNTTLAPNHIFVVPVTLTKPSIMLVLFKANQTIDFFVINSTVYKSVGALQNYYAQAKAYEGNGTFLITLNSRSGTFPEQFANTSHGNYTYFNSTILGPNTYYLVFTGNAKNATPLEYQININNTFSSNPLPIAIIGLIFILALVCGVIAIGWGLMKKGESAKDATTDAKVQQAYDQIDRHKAGKPASKNKKKT